MLFHTPPGLHMNKMLFHTPPGLHMESVGAPLYTCPVELLESGPCAEAGTENRLGQPGVLMKCGPRTSPLCDKVETLLEGTVEPRWWLILTGCQIHETRTNSKWAMTIAGRPGCRPHGWNAPNSGVRSGALHHVPPSMPPFASGPSLDATEPLRPFYDTVCMQRRVATGRAGPKSPSPSLRAPPQGRGSYTLSPGMCSPASQGRP